MSVSTYTNLITSEHADKPNYVNTVALSCQPFVDEYDALNNLDFDIDTAVGNQLDIIGQWVGMSRYLSEPLTGVYFTLDTGPGLDSGILIGPFDPTTGLVALPDQFYRALLFSKILNNQWDGTKSGAYAISAALFSSLGYTLFIQDFSNLTMSLGIAGGVPPPIVIAMLVGGLLDIRPATVHITSYIYPSVAEPMFMLDAPVSSPHFGGLDSGHFATVIPN